MVEEAPKVFISYSWDSDDHKARVLQLANKLREPLGIETDIDEYVRAKPPFTPPQGWDIWMEKRIEWAEFVLIVCTETYKRRFRGDEEPGKGLGVTWEGTIIRQHLYEGQLNNTKFIPVVFSAQDLDYVPIILKSNDKYVIENSESLRNLVYRLRRKSTVVMPEVTYLSSQVDFDQLSQKLAITKPQNASMDVQESSKAKVVPSISSIESSPASNPPMATPQPTAPLKNSQKLSSDTPKKNYTWLEAQPLAEESKEVVLGMDSRTLQQNLANLQTQGTLEECRKVITQTSQWLLQHPDESYVRNQLLKLVQSKATAEQQRQIIDETTLWLSSNLEASNSYTLTEYLKLVTSQGTPEQGQSAVSLTLKWFEQLQQNDPYVRRNCLILGKDKATPETAQELLAQTYSWLSENLEKCDSYIMMDYLRLAIERGTVEQQQKAKEQAAIWLENSDNSYVRTQYLKLLKIIG